MNINNTKHLWAAWSVARSIETPSLRASPCSFLRYVRLQIDRFICPPSHLSLSPHDRQPHTFGCTEHRCSQAFGFRRFVVLSYDAIYLVVES